MSYNVTAGVSLAYAIATRVSARINCDKNDNLVWAARHLDVIDQLIKKFMPSGSGIDQGTTLELDKSTPDKLVFSFGFHHMDEHGYYDGWTEHTAICEPDWDGVKVRITGRDRNDIKDYLQDVYMRALTQRVSWHNELEAHMKAGDETLTATTPQAA